MKEDYLPFEFAFSSRRVAFVLSAGSLLLAAVPRVIPAPTIIDWAFSTVFAAVALLCALGAILPRLFLSGLVLRDGGFEFRAPLRRPRLIAFSSIKRIEAVRGMDGPGGDDVNFRVHSPDGSVLIVEEMLRRSSLLGAIELLPGFDRTAYESAIRYEPRGTDFLLGKGFTVYEV